MITIDTIYDIFLEYPVISTDTRIIKKDSIFFALKGNNFNGNAFAQDAIAKGAAYSIIDEPKYCKDKHCICVDNVLETLQQLATIHRNHFPVPVLGITGTNGKTTTKELIASVLATDYNILATKGNLNNHIGLPLMVLQITDETEIAIFEMGASKRGDIKKLCEIAQPDYGLVTNIGTAHIESFGNTENVYFTKKELFDSVMKKNGKIFFNPNNPYFKKLNYGNITVFGRDKNCKIHCKTNDHNIYLNIEAHIDENHFNINTNLVGNYNIDNVLAALTVGNFFGISNEKIKAAIENYRPTNNRSQLIETKRNTIIADAYNANPDSMHAALQNFHDINSNKEKVLILGDMLELGSISNDEHFKLYKEIKTLGFLEIYLVGKQFYEVIKQSDALTEVFESTHELFKYVRQHPINNKLILLKGSRGIALEKIIDEL